MSADRPGPAPQQTDPRPVALAQRARDDRFVGRARELDAIDALFAHDARLVSVVGPPGIGKTRLTHEYLVAVATRASATTTTTTTPGSRVVRCDVTDARDLDGVCSTVATALDVSLEGAATTAAAVEQLGRALRERGAVLVLLDNFEQLVDLAPACVGRWLALAPAARFLVTSRELMRVPEEQVYELGPLAVPAGPDDVAAAAASELLVDRVSRRRHGYTAAGEEAAHVAAIVQALDGIPLAIELAAVRVAALGAAAVRERLSAQLALLTHGVRGAARQRTLRGAIEASWQLLGPTEQNALAQCAVFRGGFTLTAAEAVVDLGGAAGPPVFEAVQSLREKSLLTGPSGAPGAERFGLYCSIREFAEEQLLARGGDADAARARHAAYYVATAEAWAAQVDGPEGRAAVGQLLLERDNVLAVAERALLLREDAAGVPGAARALALRALLAYDPVVWRRGPVQTQLALLERALNDDGAGAQGVEPALRARALTARGRMRDRRGHVAEARADHEAARALAHAAGDGATEGLALTHLGVLGARRREFAAARAALERAAARLDAAGDRRNAAVARGWLGIVRFEQGDDAGGRALCEQALLAHRASANVAGEAVLLGLMGVLVLDRGQIAQARPWFERALALHRELGHATYESHARMYLGLLSLADGEIAAAAEHFAAANALARTTGHARAEAIAQGYLAIAQRERGALGEARERLDAAARALAEIDPRHAGLFFAYAAGVEADLGALDAAASRLRHAEATFPPDDPLAVVAAIQHVHLELARAARAPDPATAAAHHERARALLRAAEPAALAAPSMDPRIALRITARAVTRWTDSRAAGDPSAREGADTTTAPTCAGALRVDAEGEWFCTPAGVRVDCASRPVLRRLVAYLARQRIEAPGRVLRTSELLAAGWPGERILPAAARNRLKMCLATLRKLGLRGLLLTEPRGYLLDPRVPLELVPSSASQPVP